MSRNREFTPRHLVPHAQVALRFYLDLRPGERLAIAWDETVSSSLYEAFRIAADLEGVEQVAVVYRPLAEREIKEYALFAGRSLREPLLMPPALRASLAASDAWVLLGSDTELLFSPDLKDLLAQGGRGVFLPYHDADYAYRLLFTATEDAADQAALMASVGDIVDRATQVHVTSEEGTDLRLSVGQYRTLRRTGQVKPGELQILPAGNILRVPDPGSAAGILVIDRTICADDYKELHQPICLVVEGGKVVSIEGGSEARQLRRFLEGLDDPRAYNLTELGIGTNPLCKWSGIGAPSEDTHVKGTVAFALGCDTHIGGQTPAPVHIDMTMRFPNLVLDGVAVIQGGRLLAP